MRAVTAILFVILAAPGGHAETWDVRPDGTGRAVTIQAAVDSCAPGDTVLIHSGTFSGTGNRDVELRGKSILITSSFGPDSTIIDCEGSPAEPHMGFYAHEGEDGTCVISGLTIINGHGTCGVRCEWASPTIENNVFRDNNGAVIYCSHTRSVIRGNLFSNNNTGSSSPVYCVNDTSDILTNTFSGNESSEGASAIYCSFSQNRIAGNVIEYGYTYPGSDAPVTCRYGAYRIEDNRIENNIVFYGNGKGIACSFSEAAITGNTISGNSGIGQSQTAGGGIYCNSCECSISGNTISGNSFASGGGIYINDSEGSSISGNTISGNDATWIGASMITTPEAEETQRRLLSSPAGLTGWGIGGGIFCVDTDTLSITGNVITDNIAWIAGGICCYHSSPLIEWNQIARNISTTYVGANYQDGGIGGGICCVESSPLIKNNTIDGNKATRSYSGIEMASQGGGIYIAGNSSPGLIANIISRNQTTSGDPGGGVYCDSTSAPSFSCNDFFGNEDEDFGGYLASPIGLDGNFSADPHYCTEYHYSIYTHSPCAPGNHPAGADCGLIGAVEPMCTPISTLLSFSEVTVNGSRVILTWILSERMPDAKFIVRRSGLSDNSAASFGDFEVSPDGAQYTFVDATCKPGFYYSYAVETVSNNERRVLFETSPVRTESPVIAMSQNYPNPFNPSTSIAFYLPERCLVRIDIYDAAGRHVVRLAEGTRESGPHQARWDGLDEAGKPAVSGVYFYRLTAGKNSINRKMVLLR